MALYVQFCVQRNGNDAARRADPSAAGKSRIVRHNNVTGL